MAKPNLQMAALSHEDIPFALTAKGGYGQQMEHQKMTKNDPVAFLSYVRSDDDHDGG